MADASVTVFDCCDKRGLRERLNLIAAAATHVAWKQRLGDCIRGREPLASVCVEQACHLGELLEGAAFCDFFELDEYRLLFDAHRKFHQTGAAVVERLRSDDRAGASAMFENEYSQALRDILQSLCEINRLLTE